MSYGPYTLFLPVSITYNIGWRPIIAKETSRPN